MGRSYHLNLWLDDELSTALEAHARNAGLTRSQVTRDLLRHALGLVSSPRDSAWVEAYNSVVADARRKINQALRRIADEIGAE
jgi:hypothetical protein